MTVKQILPKFPQMYSCSIFCLFALLKSSYSKMFIFVEV